MSRSSEYHRQIDRYCGIPLAFGAGLLTRRRTLPPAPRRIGVIAASAIGDTVLASGVLAHLNKTYPTAELHLFVGPAARPALELLETDVFGHLCDFTRPWSALAEIRSVDLDILIDLTPWPRATALVARCTGARCTVGFRSWHQYRHYPFNISVEHSIAEHETENLRRLANLFAPLEVYSAALRSDFAAPSLDLPYERLILLHAFPGGSRAAAKSWPASSWVELARRLLRDRFAVAFTGSAADAEKLAPMLSQLGSERCFDLAGRLTLGELAYTIRKAPLTIAVDTAILHIASALDRPVIGLHGPSRGTRWGATNPVGVRLQAPHPAAGYESFGFERLHPEAFEIMRTITVNEVYRLAAQLLEKAQPKALIK